MADEYKYVFVALVVLLIIYMFYTSSETFLTIPNTYKVYGGYNVSNNFSTKGYTQPTSFLSDLEHAKADDYDSSLPADTGEYKVEMLKFLNA